MTGVTSAEWDHEFGGSGADYAGDDGQYDDDPSPYNGTYSEE
jgi:hypothetical protein